MNLKVTSSVPADRFVLEVLNPQEETPFEELLLEAQEVLAFLKGSRFLLQLVNKDIPESFFIIDQESNSRSSERLVITGDFRIRFVHPNRHNFAPYNYGDHFHSTLLLAKSRVSLEQMQTPAGFIKFLISRHGKPSFTAEDVQAEMTRNGQIHVINFTALDEKRANITREEAFRQRMEALQFVVKYERRDYYDDSTPLPDSGQFIVLVDIDAPAATQVFNRLSPAQRQRIWTAEMSNYDRKYGQSKSIERLIASPDLYDCLQLSDEKLLNRLSTMFTDPE